MWIVFSPSWWCQFKCQSCWFTWCLICPFKNCYLLLALLVLRNHCLTQAHKDLCLWFFEEFNSLTLLSFVLYFWLWCAELRILFPRPGINPASPILGVLNLNHWPSREVTNSSHLVFGLFWVNSCIWCEEGVQPHLFLHINTQFLQHHFLKDYSFLIEMSWHTLLVFMTCKKHRWEAKLQRNFLMNPW